MSHEYSAYPGLDHAVVATLKDGRIMAYACIEETPTAAATYYYNIHFPDLKEIEYVLQVQINTQPYTDVKFPMNKYVRDNIVGLTVYPDAGCTITIDAIAIGPP